MTYLQPIPILSIYLLFSCHGFPPNPRSAADASARDFENSLSLHYDSVAFGPASLDSYLVVPTLDQARPAGVLFLMCGFAEAPQSILPETDLPRLAADAGLRVVLLGNGPHLATTPAVLDRLDVALAHFRENTPGAAGLPHRIGGFSAGGTHALRYVEHCRERGDAAPVQWRSVFTVDSPVDLFDTERYLRREVAIGTASAGTDEASFAIRTLAQDLGTLPRDSGAFSRATPFAMHRSARGNERFLLGTRVRVYHDIDVPWLLDERGRTASEDNSVAASALILALRNQGHEEADFIQATGRGYRSNGARHPHSWSIEDGLALVDWLGDSNLQ